MIAFVADIPSRKSGDEEGRKTPGVFGCALYTGFPASIGPGWAPNDCVDGQTPDK